MRDAVKICARVVYELAIGRIPSWIPGSGRLRVRCARLFVAEVAPDAHINEGVRLASGVRLLARAGIGARSSFVGTGPVVIEPGVTMGPECMFITGDHPVPGDGERFSSRRPATSEIVIGDGAFLGARVTVLPGVTIGRGAAIGAGSVVVDDIPPGATAVGNPARVVRQREPPPIAGG